MFKKKRKGIPIKLILILLFVFIFFGGLIYLNLRLKVKNINVEIFPENIENQEIKTYVESLLRKSGNTFFGFLTTNDSNITKLTHDEYPIVSDVHISKTHRLDFNVVVKKNEEFFSTCVSPELGFLVTCMIGNVDGIYYKEIEATTTDAKRLNIEVNPKVLFSVQDSKPLENIDSLSGTRIYTKEDFLILREMVNWMQKNGFKIEKVYVDELKIVSIKTDFYTLRVNLEKGYVDTVKDFELISRVGNLQKYINDEKEKIDYIDLSYKNKVFYKLKGESEIITETSTSTATTTTQ